MLDPDPEAIPDGGIGLTHRKHVHGWEIMPVAETIRMKLIEMVPYHDPQEPLMGDAIDQFHVLYRFENNRVGRPAYPEPETWETLAEYLNMNYTANKQEPSSETPAYVSLKTPSQWDQMCPRCGEALEASM
jgi:hypothetical protein